MNTKYCFKRNQLMALATVVLLCPVLRLFPSGAAELAGRAAWLTAPAAAPLLLGYIFFLSRFMSCRNEGEGLAELILRALGRKAGSVLLVLLSLWLLLYAGFVLRSGADRAMTTIYPNSSHEVFCVSMGLLAFAAVLGPARSLVRMAKMVQPVVLGVLLIVLLTAVFSIDGANLLPVTSYDVLPIFEGSLATIDVIVIVLYAVCFLEGFSQKQEGRFKSFAIWLGLILLLLTLLGIDVIGTFGAELTARLTRPFFSLVRNLVFFRTLERVEALVVSLWIFPDFLMVSLILYAAQHSLRRALGEEPEYRGERIFSAKGKRWLIWVCTAAAIICSLLIAPRSQMLERWSIIIIPLINLGVAVIVLPVIYIVGKIRKTL